MTPEKQALFASTMARREAVGQPLTYRTVYPLVRGSKREFTRAMKAWHAARRGNGAVAVLEPDRAADDNGQDAPAEPPVVAPAPRPRQPLLLGLAQERRQIQRDLEAVQQRVEQNAKALAEAKWQAHTRLVQLRNAVMLARQVPLHAVEAAIQEQDRCRHKLAVYVGEEETRRAEHNMRYVPRGLA